MEVRTATSAAGRPGRGNEDAVVTTPVAVVLVDGAAVPGWEQTCRHGIAWYSTTLAKALAAQLDREAAAALTDLLATAIADVTDQHRATCAVGDPSAPCAAVAALRIGGAAIEYLVLGDATIVLDRVAGPPVACTDRREVVIAAEVERALRGVEVDGPEHRRLLAGLRSRRNAAGGFWVARDDPAAAQEAVTGSMPLADLRAAVLLSNGVSRLVEPLAATDWPGLLRTLARSGPDTVIRTVRDAEAATGLAPDDATVAHVRLAT